MVNECKSGCVNGCLTRAHLLCSVFFNLFSYFFTCDEVAALFAAAGLEPVETEYVTVELYNRKKDFPMKRVFVHGVFRKPDR